MVHVTQKEIQKAFRNHKSVVDISNLGCRTSKLVLFYAVECGLKALYMRENKLKRTDQENSLKESAFYFRHNLNHLLVKMNMNIKIPKLVAKDNSQIEPEDLHAAWRYGKELDNRKELRCIERLKDILKELELKLL